MLRFLPLLKRTRVISSVIRLRNDYQVDVENTENIVPESYSLQSLEGKFSSNYICAEGGL